ncbi:MAG: hypothetical protein A3B99_03880 [Candidatus Yanofskybacteria bacterium RIFCSPHIGHO2_02_FULL_44_12b]|uniref:Uncharacterized protein n=1 Tax=Candidatus Yanofskybacteria bacterium RIFCSPLOWO2_01_FULL_44_22 TaxID=1802697 RepID=A0A1F8GMS8_9BACT|nr:MAG: hypothetical protein A2659_00960 [Candidatus Yanofskybacteria bacterium RIFCSPHIGHO2_01_FULL_44_24]OGN15659.1 MAG: hypothetical protein A3B99_03880 [Candidatus Yanofskybacteria bacterium RIFCSPHIGHO2_02_FULL_44_12b]OGN26715.1 MAG: hypothetical protein A2925_03965 [Candidatus Yanofskybacteria bacterium RIFCSPLOWO2_01_FULL_44_22]
MSGNRKTPIYVTVGNFWKEVEEAGHRVGMPPELISCLRVLIGSHIHSQMGPRASPHLIRLAKEYVLGGVVISDFVREEERVLEVMVFIPKFNPDPEKVGHPFFKLVPTYSNGVLRRLQDILPED